MLQSLKKRFDREDEGFTLIELMVVVLIIAILLAIAIPTFLGARDRANDRAAQSSLRNALTAAKTLYTDSQDYTVATAAALPSIEPSLSYSTVASGSGDFKEVAVDASSATAWTGAALSKTGTCFGIKDTATGTQYAKATPASGAACTTSTMTFSATSKW